MQHAKRGQSHCGFVGQGLGRCGKGIHGLKTLVYLQSEQVPDTSSCLSLRLKPTSAATPSMTPIQPIIINNLKKAISVSSQLRALGFLVPVIRPPTVPAGTSRLRISISALHSKKDIIILTSVINRLLSE